MIDEKAEGYIEESIKREKNKAIANHGDFHSHHEAIAVLAEETEEVVDCFKPFERTLNAEMPGLWDLIRADNVDESTLGHIEQIRGRALEMAKECVQVCAMCDKWVKLIKKENEA